MRGETTANTLDLLTAAISIHSPHARGDVLVCAAWIEVKVISIHSPHARGDDKYQVLSADKVEFQSTPLMRGETRDLRRMIRSVEFQSTPLMRGETESRQARGRAKGNFNPLPSCEGRPGHKNGLTILQNFNPLPSCEGRQHAGR